MIEGMMAGGMLIAYLWLSWRLFKRVEGPEHNAVWFTAAFFQGLLGFIGFILAYAYTLDVCGSFGFFLPALGTDFMRTWLELHSHG